MTRFTVGGDTTWGRGKGVQGSTTILAENQAGFDNWAGMAANAVADAIKLLERVDAQLHNKKPSDKVVKYASRYFLTDAKSISEADLDIIKTVITKTRNGLSGNVTLKVGVEKGGTRGYVTGKRQNGAARPATQGFHNVAASMDDGREWRQGAIHVSGARFEDERLGVKTLIHEATHKYAGTIDYVYMHDDGTGSRGDPSATFDNKTKALMNADSYAWFVLKVGRSYFGFHNVMYG
jgi:hypothetical protein